jgi:hypothetical protein
MFGAVALRLPLRLVTTLVLGGYEPKGTVTRGAPMTVEMEDEKYVGITTASRE